MRSWSKARSEVFITNGCIRERQKTREAWTVWTHLALWFALGYKLRFALRFELRLSLRFARRFARRFAPMKALKFAL